MPGVQWKFGAYGSLFGFSTHNFNVQAASLPLAAHVQSLQPSECLKLVPGVHEKLGDSGSSTDRTCLGRSIHNLKVHPPVLPSALPKYLVFHDV